MMNPVCLFERGRGGVNQGARVRGGFRRRIVGCAIGVLFTVFCGFTAGLSWAEATDIAPSGKAANEKPVADKQAAARKNSAQKDHARTGPAALPLDDAYIIGVDDKVSVSVWRNPDLSLTVPVRPDGRISTPLVGDVIAAGKTPMQLAKDIERALSVFIREPNVSVILVGLASYEYLSRVRITGAVRAPVSLPYRKGMTVLDLVLAAGGPSDFAAANRTVLYRTNEKGEAKRIQIKLDHLLKKGDIDSNLALKPGDILTVPESLF